MRLGYDVRRPDDVIRLYEYALIRDDLDQISIESNTG